MAAIQQVRDQLLMNMQRMLTCELRETVLVGRPSAAKESLLGLGARVLAQETFARTLVLRSFPLERCLLLRVTSVVTSGVSMPCKERVSSHLGDRERGKRLTEVDQHIGKRLASLDINHADVHELQNESQVSILFRRGRDHTGLTKRRPS